MPISSVQDLFLYELGLIYDAEYRFLEGQQEMAQEATDQNLRDSLQGHIDQTEQQIRNLEEVYGQLGQEPRRLTSEGAQGLVSEAQQSIREARGEAMRDCAINAAIVRVEHFEMGTYRGMVTGAQQMGRDEVVDLLQQNLNQEEETAQIAQQRGPELVRRAL